jgi:hypothetical protein
MIPSGISFTFLHPNSKDSKVVRQRSFNCRVSGIFGLVLGLAAIAAHLDDPRIKPGKDIDQVLLLRHDDIDIFVYSRHFVGSGRQDFNVAISRLES